jgi:hypothetical protein
MRAKYINEKFKEDTDPIKDMGIGTEKVDFREKEYDIRPTIHIKNWLKFLEGFIGKIIKGKFKDDDNNIIDKEFKIKNFGSYDSGNTITFSGNNINYYEIIKDEIYFVSR